jgi:hypothetical protein
MATVETPAFRPGFHLRTALKGGVSNRSWFYDDESPSPEKGRDGEGFGSLVRLIFTHIL